MRRAFPTGAPTRRRAVAAGLAGCAVAAGCGRIGFVEQADQRPGLAAARADASATDHDAQSGQTDASRSRRDAGGALADHGVSRNPLDARTPAVDGGHVIVDAAPRDAASRDSSIQVLDASGTPDAADASCNAPCCCAYLSAFGTVPAASVCGGASDASRFSFDTDAQGWVLANTADVLIPGQVLVSATHVFAGSAALQATTSVPAGSEEYVRLMPPPASLAPGNTVTFHVWIPPGANLLAVQPYVMDTNYVWTGSYVEPPALVLGCWATIQVAVPITFQPPAWEIGVEFLATPTAPFNAVVYVDSVTW